MHLLVGIIYLTIIFVVRTDGTVGSNLPFLVCGNPFCRAIYKLDEYVDATFGQSENGSLIGLVLSHGEHTTVSQYKTDGILLL